MADEGWLGALRGSDVSVDGVDQPRRGKLNFIGGVVTDNPDSGAVDVDLGSVTGSTFGAVTIALSTNGTIAGTGIDTATLVVVQPNAPLFINSIKRPAAGSQINSREFFNDSAFPITILFNSSSYSSTANERILSATGATSFTWEPKTSIYDAYDYNASGGGKWRQSPEQATTAVDGVLVSELSAIVITADLDGAVRFCTGGDAENDDRGGMFYCKFGDASSAVPGINIAATGGRWKRIQSNFKRALCLDFLSGTRRGAYDGEVVYCMGYYYTGNPSIGVGDIGDNGGGWFVWAAASTATIDGGLVFGRVTFSGAGALVPNPDGAGRWLRMKSSTAARSAKEYGAIGNGYAWPANGASTRSDRDAIQTMMNNAQSECAELLLTDGQYYLDDTLYYPANSNNMRLRGVGAVTLNYYGSALIAAPNPADTGILEQGSCAVLMRGVTPTIENIRIRVGGTTSVGHGIGLGYLPSETVGALTEARILRCSIQGSTASGNGSMRFGITVDPYYMQGANAENIEINSTVHLCTIACIWNRASVQSYNLVIRGEGMQSLGGFLNGNEPWGIGLLNDSTSTSIWMLNLDIERVACWVRLRAYPDCLTMRGISGEVVKKICYANSGSSQSYCAMSFEDFRVSVSSLSHVSSGGLEVFAAGDRDLFNLTANHPAFFKNLSITEGFLDTPCFLGCQDNSITVVGSHWTHENFVHRQSSFGSPNRGKTTVIGCTAQDAAGNGIAIADRHGAENGSGTVVITGAATTADVVWAIADTVAVSSTTTVINLTTGGLTVSAHVGSTASINGNRRVITANTANTLTLAAALSVAPTAGQAAQVFVGGFVPELVADYNIDVTVVGDTGVVASARVRDGERLITGFKIRLSVAPGGSDTTTVRWKAWR